MSSLCSTDARPRMLVKLRLSYCVVCSIPSPLEGKYYKFRAALPQTVSRDILVDDPWAHLSTLDAAEEVIAPFVVPKGRPPLDEVSRLPWPRIISRFAHATARSAEALGHGYMEVVAEANYFQEMKLDEICELGADRRPGHEMEEEEEEPRETCAVCLDEIKERARSVTLACPHVFHLRCIAAWLSKENSCPLCRSKQPIFRDD